MNFNIQISNPTAYKSISNFADSLEDAIEGLFPMDTEDAVINWNGALVALNYKYDISVICEDIIDMLECIINNENGELNIEWPSNTFRTTWFLKWKGDILECEAKWLSVSGNIEKTLNNSNNIRLAKKDFISEWGTLIKKITECLLQVGYTTERIGSLERMLKITEKIPISGKLYRND